MGRLRGWGCLGEGDEKLGSEFNPDVWLERQERTILNQEKEPDQKKGFEAALSNWPLQKSIN
jgi:hypothetical protein